MATLQPTLLTSFREPDGAVMTADMKLQGWERRIGAPSLRGLQGRSATNQNGQAAKEKMSCGLDAARIFLASGSGRSVFCLTSPFIGLPGSRLLAANIFDLFFTRGFSEKRYSFPVGFLFHEEGSLLPAKIF